MIQTADIYIRVSTDEQADKGYSQRHQDESLHRYCELHQIHIRHIIYEDHSAKNFQRPQFQQWFMKMKKTKQPPDLFLFTKWDRFSRNAADAYAMIATLNKMGIEPQAMEQPLDLQVPENKMMLAFYLAAPEVENDRRSLNVSAGMRKAMKEGRYMGKAPVGYVNKKNEREKWIEPDPVTAPFIKQIFEEIALGKYSAESILKFTRAKGFRCSKNNFWNIVRCPVYAGKIYLPPYKHEAAQLVTGKHMPLISEQLFHQVQDVLDGRKKIQRTQKTVDDRFPLRGFIRCHSCGRLLTASASKGRKQYYEYYHCTASCRTRYAASALNDGITMELASWKPHPAVKVLYKLILQDVIEQNDQHRKQQLQQIRKDLNLQQSRLSKARDLLLTDALQPDDYKVIKSECERSISRMEAQVAELVQQQVNLQPLIDSGITALEKIDTLYNEASTTDKRTIIDSMFPEKLEFHGTGFRTTRVNEAVRLIFNLGAAFGEIKKGQNPDLSALTHEVTPLVHFSNHFLYDLRRLATLCNLLKAS